MKKRKDNLMFKWGMLFLLIVFISYRGKAENNNRNNRNKISKHQTSQGSKAQIQKNKSHSNIKSKANEKVITVGDYLKQANRGENLEKMTKNSSEIPQGKSDLFAEKKQINLYQVKPPPSRSSFLSQQTSDDKVKLERILDQQINELYKLTEKFKTSPRRGELWLRLAELYVEKAGYIDFRKRQEYDDKLRDFQSGKTKIKPRLDIQESQAYNLKAIQLYEWFVEQFPKDPKMDQALYFLGYNYYEINKVDKGTIYYKRLAANYPNSIYILESNFALGEYYFEIEKWNEAAQHYSKVVDQQKNKLFSFSLYKLAWCEFRAGHTQAAIKKMEKLIRLGRYEDSLDKSRRNSGGLKLEQEALRDLVLFYAEGGKAEAAPEYFNEIAGKQAIQFLVRLAYYYSDKGNRENARYLFNYLIQQDPTNAKAFDYKYQIVRGLWSSNKTKEFREELYDWIKNFSTTSDWFEVNKGKNELIENSEKLREVTLRNWVLQNHQTAQNSRAPFSQGLAYDGYRLYMASFPNDLNAADMHFYFAELLYDMKRFDEAALHYKWVVENGQKSKFYQKAAENVVLALERSVPTDQEIAKLVGDNVEPVEMNAQINKFIIAAKWYSDKFTQSEKAVELKFRIGRLYYQHNQFDKAIPYFKEIIATYSKTKYAEYSANLLLDIYNLKKDYVGLEKTGLELLAVPSIANSQAGKDIRDVVEKASFKKAQDLEVNKDYGKSAEAFVNFSKKHPNSSLATTAMFNAAINFERAGKNQNALAAHAVVLKSMDKKDDSLKTQSRRILAKLYQDSGQLEEAANAYHKSAIEAGKDPVALNLFFNSAVMFESLGEDSQATSNYETFFEKSKKREKFEVLFQLGEIHRRRGSMSKAIDKYKEYVMAGGASKDKVVESAYWVYVLDKKLNRKTESQEWRKKAIYLQRNFAPNKKGPGAAFAAKIKLDDAIQTFEDLKSVRIPVNPAKQNEAVQKKISLITSLNKELTEVIKFDSPDEIVGGLNLLGQANLHMYEAIMNAPLPQLNEQEKKEYLAGIQKIADPFLTKAKESFKAAVDRGQELEGYPEAYFVSRDMIIKLDPKLIYEGSELSIPSNYLDWME